MVMNYNWYYLLVAILLVLLLFRIEVMSYFKGEGFVSGEERLMSIYDQIYPLDHPKYTTPQQKDFQIVLSEHSALDPNLQNRRKDIRTQKCPIKGGHCFSTREWHALNYGQRSAPDVINSQMEVDDPIPNEVVYLKHSLDKVVPSNSTAREMRADLFDDIVLPDLFFKKKKVIYRGEPDPNVRQYSTQIY